MASGRVIDVLKRASILVSRARKRGVPEADANELPCAKALGASCRSHMPPTPGGVPRSPEPAGTEAPGQQLKRRWTHSQAAEREISGTMVVPKSAVADVLRHGILSTLLGLRYACSAPRLRPPTTPGALPALCCAYTESPQRAAVLEQEWSSLRRQGARSALTGHGRCVQEPPSDQGQHRGNPQGFPPRPPSAAPRDCAWQAVSCYLPVRPPSATCNPTSDRPSAADELCSRPEPRHVCPHLQGRALAGARPHPTRRAVTTTPAHPASNSAPGSHSRA